jgi:hypothetical protein
VQQWEYLTIAVTGSTWSSLAGTGTLPAIATPRGESTWPPDELCNELGLARWELVGVAGSSEVSSYTLFFRRQRL